MIKNISFLFILVVLNTFTGISQTIFGWETAIQNEDGEIKETVNGITAKVSLNNVSTGNLFLGRADTPSNRIHLIGNQSTIVSVKFDQPVDIISIKGEGGLNMDGETDNVMHNYENERGNVVQKTQVITGQLDTVNLGWTNVTSFTITFSGSMTLFSFEDLVVKPHNESNSLLYRNVTSYNLTSSQKTFGWETATQDEEGVVKETINGITAKVSVNSESPGNLFLGKAQTPSNRIHLLANQSTIVSFRFNQPVDIVSLKEGGALNSDGVIDNVTYSYENQDGNVVSETHAITGQLDTVNLGWNNITLFTVTFSGSMTLFSFEDLVVKKHVNSVMVYPNPVEGILYIKNNEKVNAIGIYNNYGRLLSTHNSEEIDMNNYPKGSYILQIKSENNIENKQIIKK